MRKIDVTDEPRRILVTRATNGLIVNDSSDSKRYHAEQIGNELREIDVLVANGNRNPEVRKFLGSADFQ